MTSTWELVSLTISANGFGAGAAKFWARVADPLAAPSWYSATSTCASPLAPLPSLNWAATRLTAVTGSPMSIWTMPPGETSAGVSPVTAPITPIVMPFTVKIVYSGSAGVLVPFWYTLAPRYAQRALVPPGVVPLPIGQASGAAPAGPAMTRVV